LQPIIIGYFGQSRHCTPGLVSLSYFLIQYPLKQTTRYNVGRMISQELLDILVCPLCKKPVALTPGGTGLKCGGCRRVYPIQDDIPIMLIDSATIDAS
jgi:hypothetical protein